MSATTLAASTLPWAIRRGAVAVWHDLPRAILAGLLGTVSLVPFVLALTAAAPGWIVGATVLLPALAATMIAGIAARAVRHHGIPLRAFVSTDPVLALMIGAVAILAGMLLISPGSAQLAGAALAALLLFVGCPALAYGAVRGRRGLAALRGGILLALMRPGWALTLTAFAVLAGFAVAASAGVLAVVAAPFLLGVAASLVSYQLDEVDALQGVA